MSTSKAPDQPEERHLIAVEDGGDHYVLKFHKSETESPFMVKDPELPDQAPDQGGQSAPASGDAPASGPKSTQKNPGATPSTQRREAEQGGPSHPQPLTESGEEQKKQSMDTSAERRFVGVTNLELREAGPDGRRAEGYAAVFDTPTTIRTLRGAFREVLTRSAFDGRLEDNVLALFNHDQDSPLAKVGAGLELSLDDHGLRFSFPIPDTTTGRDLVELMDRGIVQDASFAFTVGEDGQSWTRDEDADIDVRTITKLDRLVDISVVTVGAYPDASSSLRSFEGAKFNEPADADPDVQPGPENPSEAVESAPDSLLSLGGLRSAIIRAKRATF